ncbi:uncharacterized protein LOC143301087 [Babylonia areolata]|uniref:uncharacterized protein LOC143301087 n=1 Tax=Babylonia areolata TaxID=304850 RepID=UPI003FD0336C
MALELDHWRASSLDSRSEKVTSSSSGEMWHELTCRRRTLKVINTRPVLVAICTFVVIECACVLAELMVDLQGIKFRFENEEKEVNRFVAFLKANYPDQVASWGEASSVEDLIQRIKDSLVVRSRQDLAEASVRGVCCPCPQDCVRGRGDGDPQHGADSIHPTTIPANNNNQNNNNQNNNNIPNSNPRPPNLVPHETSDKTDPPTDSASLVGGAAVAAGASASGSGSTFSSARTSGSGRPLNPENLFVLEINNVKDSFFLVAEYAPEHIQLNETKHRHYETEYMRIHKASTALHITSLVILSFMVIETIVKFVCMGTAFLKKKFEVFDAFIVISSFALDFVFLDSRWYETGKDAATILVLLLPWRVVRIVNSFLMTVKHKHHIAIMTIKRAKKRADFKNAKLQTLLSEIRKDVQLLVALCRNSQVPEADITACLYGLGRRSTTLNAVTSCTTIMLVSALGKDASLEDEIYGRLFADALRDPVEHDSEPEAKKAEEEAIDAAIELEKQMEQQSKRAARAAFKTHNKRARGQVTRSYTVPRRAASIEHNLEAANGATAAAAAALSSSSANGDNGSVFYINDAFATPRGPGSKKRGSAGGVLSSPPETLAGLAAGGPGGSSAACQPVTEEEEDGADGTGESGGKSSWEGRLPPKCKSKASVRSLPGPGPGQNYVPLLVTVIVVIIIIVVYSSSFVTAFDLHEVGKTTTFLNYSLPPPKDCTQFLDFLRDQGQQQMVTFPTRELNTLDLFVTDFPTLFPRIEGVPGFFAVYMDFQIQPERRNMTKRLVPCYKRADWAALHSAAVELSNSITASYTTSSNTELIWSAFREGFYQIVHSHIPHATPKATLTFPLPPQRPLSHSPCYPKGHSHIPLTTPKATLTFPMPPQRPSMGSLGWTTRPKSSSARGTEHTSAGRNQTPSGAQRTEARSPAQTPQKVLDPHSPPHRGQHSRKYWTHTAHLIEDNTAESTGPTQPTSSRTTQQKVLDPHSPPHREQHSRKYWTHTAHLIEDNTAESTGPTQPTSSRTTQQKVLDPHSPPHRGQHSRKYWTHTAHLIENNTAESAGPTQPTSSRTTQQKVLDPHSPPHRGQHSRKYWTHTAHLIENKTAEGGGVSKGLWAYVKAKRTESTNVSPLKVEGRLVTDAQGQDEILNRQFQSVFSKRSPCTPEDFVSRTGLSPIPEGPTCDPITIGEDGVRKLLRNLNTTRPPNPQRAGLKDHACPHATVPVFNRLGGCSTGLEDS